ncbi:hypothetical protein [Neglectibacter caecimuris]|uniref:hypothetical protein n=1 Tax=Neglectibacter caecimuris TaxID=3093658 RepID=UPI002AC8F1E6|nr:hypothetical protein [Neglectibacter sp. M00184]
MLFTFWAYSGSFDASSFVSAPTISKACRNRFSLCDAFVLLRAFKTASLNVTAFKVIFTFVGAAADALIGIAATISISANTQATILLNLVFINAFPPFLYLFDLKPYSLFLITSLCFSLFGKI